MKLSDNRVLICLGPGGVGKTTTSVALALKAANSGKKCLVMTIDPSRRLASILGLDVKSNKAKLIMKKESGGELWGKIIEPEIALKEFVKKNSQDHEQIEKLFANKLFKQLTSNLKDSQDFTSIESLALAVNDKKYDLIILDTPPIQNLFDFLNAPENMFNLFNSRLVSLIGQTSDSKGLIRKFIGTGAKGILALLAKVTGKVFVEELILFFKCLESLAIEIKEHSQNIKNVLEAKTTGYLLITEPNEVKLLEAQEIISQLKDKKFLLKAMIFNRAYPKWYQKPETSGIQPENLQIFDKEFKFYQKLNKSLDIFCKQKVEIGNIIKVPVLTNISELSDIEAMADFL